MNSLLILLLLFLGIFLSIKKSNFRVGVDGMLFFSLSYLIYAGLRDITFGEDSVNYFNNYYLLSHQYGSILEFISSADVFFRFINHLLLYFSSNWYFYSFTMACICLYLVIKIDSFSERKVFFFTALIVTNPVFIENTTNILRSTLCCLILMFGYLIDRKKKSITLIVFGSLTHYFQAIIIWVIFITARINLLKNNKHLKLFASGILITVLLKTFTSIIQIDKLSEYSEIINLFLSSNNIVNYTMSQVLSDKTEITINVFFQLILYIIIPLFFIKFEDLKDKHKKILNVTAIALTLYVFLYPEFILVLRVIPICILGITYLFTFKMNNYNKIYTLLILFFNSVLIFYNSSNA
jgi:hypothetical protein